MAKTRTFIAIEASDDVRERALSVIDLLQPVAPGVKWVAKENLHWTLQFLGDVGDAELSEVCRRVVAAVSEFAPFTLTASGIGAFPKPSRPRTLWLGAREGQEAMCRLQQAVEESLANLGFRGERRQYVPHLTLGRLSPHHRGGDELVEWLENLDDFDGGTMQIDQVTVQASYLSREGPTYQIMARAPLEG